MTEKRYILSDFFWEVLDTKYDWLGNTEPFSKEVIEEEDYLLIGRAKTQEDGEKICNLLNKLTEENEQLKEFIDDLTTKGTGRIDLANGYSYSVSAVLTNWKGDVK